MKGTLIGIAYILVMVANFAIGTVLTIGTVLKGILYAITNIKKT